MFTLSFCYTKACLPGGKLGKGSSMAQSDKLIGWQTVAGQPVTVNDITVTPLAQTLTVRWPQGGLAWNRPVALLVQQADTQQRRVPITDVTRLVQLALLGSGLLLYLAIVRSRSHHSDQEKMV